MKTKKRLRCFSLSLIMPIILAGCAATENFTNQNTDATSNGSAPYEESTEGVTVTPTAEITTLEDGISVVRYNGEDGFEDFLAEGGASSDGEVVSYLAENLLSGLDLGDIVGSIFGCSTIASKTRQEKRCLVAISIGRTAKP